MLWLLVSRFGSSECHLWSLNPLFSNSSVESDFILSNWFVFPPQSLNHQRTDIFLHYCLVGKKELFRFWIFILRYLLLSVICYLISQCHIYSFRVSGFCSNYFDNEFNQPKLSNWLALTLTLPSFQTGLFSYQPLPHFSQVFIWICCTYSRHNLNVYLLLQVHLYCIIFYWLTDVWRNNVLNNPILVFYAYHLLIFPTHGYFCIFVYI